MTDICFLSLFCVVQVARWTVGKLAGDKNPQLNGTILLNQHATSTSTSVSGGSGSGSSGMMSPGSAGDAGRVSETAVAPVIEVHWRVPMASVSGLAVASLQMTNERYKPYKGVRTVAKSGKFVVRCV